MSFLNRIFNSPDVLFWNLLIVMTPTLSFFSYSTLLTWIVSRLMAISFSTEPRLIVNVTLVPFYHVPFLQLHQVVYF